jgi:hypothetical protein
MPTGKYIARPSAHTHRPSDHPKPLQTRHHHLRPPRHLRQSAVCLGVCSTPCARGESGGEDTPRPAREASERSVAAHGAVTVWLRLALLRHDRGVARAARRLTQRSDLPAVWATQDAPKVLQPPYTLDAPCSASLH